MSDFLFAYGLFAAKAISIVIIILLAIAALLTLLASRTKDKEVIEIEKMNDKFDNLKSALEEELYTKEELKELNKQKKKQEKKEAKLLKKRSKQSIDEPIRNRLFVIRFDGDLHASDVYNLRESITAILTVARKEDEVLVILESAGGLVHTYGLAASQLYRIRERGIALTASVDLIAASGGYLMAAVAQKIIAAPFAVVGSIGVLAQIPNFHKLLKKHDIEIEQHTAGEYKTTLTMLGENTAKARAKFQEELEDTHKLFKRFVKQNRPELDIQKLATGEHWYGAEAIELKLVDEIMTSDDYLLSKSANSDIFEVNYIIQETLVDKISNAIHGVSAKVFNKFFPTAYSPIK